MLFNAKTKVSEILEKFPWLPAELKKIDGRLDIVNNPLAKMMIKNATVADLCAKAGISVDDALKKLQELIDSHKG